jgi:hypothetical protein
VDTTSLDSALQEIVVIYGREFQRYSVNNRIYLCPVDDVCTDSQYHKEMVIDLHEITDFLSLR